MDRMYWKTSPEVAPNCPRCASSNTKFCYYNNYSLSQPRYFCKACRRYWTKGGSLRNVPVGGGCRKTRRAKSASREAEQHRRYCYSSISMASTDDVRESPDEQVQPRSSLPDGNGHGFIGGSGEHGLVDRNSVDELDALLLGEEDDGQWSIPAEWQPPMVAHEAHDFGALVGGGDHWTAGGSAGLAETSSAGNLVDDVWRSFDLSGYENLSRHYYENY